MYIQTRLLLIIISSFSLINTISSQKIKLVEGNIESLKGITAYNIVFNYSNIKIANYISEEEFLIDKMKIRERKEKGSGEKFKKDWFSNRESLYEPKFIKTFNDFFTSKVKIKVEKNNSLKYTMLIDTKYIYSGYNVGIWNEDSKIKATLTIFETKFPKIIIVKSKEIYVKGKATYSSGNRISNAYARLARRITFFLRKKAF